MADIEALAQRYSNGELTGHKLAEMMHIDEISKSDRRKIVRLAESLKKKGSGLSERQKLRLEVKEKKAAPKLTKEERKRKFQPDLDTARDKEKANFIECLGCRKRGHYLKDCPKAFKGGAAESVAANVGEICFNCGSYEHSLRDCPVPRRPGKLPYASCFICKKQGHISRDCPENANGLYPKGGCCHICFQKTHLVKDCPERTEEDRELARIKREQHQNEEDGVRTTAASTSEAQRGDDLLLDGDYEWQAGNDDESEEEGAKRKKSRKSKSKKQSY